MNIIGDKIKLRALELEDMKIMREIINNPEVESLVGGWSFPISKKEQEKWYEKEYDNKKNIRLAIETEKDGVIGMANLVNIDWKNRHAFHGIKIGAKDYRGKGYGTDVVMAIMEYAFFELGLNKLHSTILDYNTPSQNLYIDKCGWVEEGRQRNHVFKGNKFHDQIIVGILKDEYEKLLAENN